MSEHNESESVRDYLARIQREALAERGCCTITWDDGSSQLNGVTEERCRRAARRVGGSFSFHPGRICGSD